MKATLYNEIRALIVLEIKRSRRLPHWIRRRAHLWLMHRGFPACEPTRVNHAKLRASRLWTEDEQFRRDLKKR